MWLLPCTSGASPCFISHRAPLQAQPLVSFSLQVVRESLYDAFYKLTDSRSQITSYVFDEVGVHVDVCLVELYAGACC